MTNENEVDEFLAHFGVKGMKWGVVHEVDSTGRATAKVDRAQSRQDRRESKAQKFDKTAIDAQTKIDALKSAGTRTAYAQTLADLEIKDLSKIRDRALSDAEAKRNGKLTSTQKKVIVGAAVTAAIIGAVVIKGNLESGEFNRLAMKGQAFLEGKKNLQFKTDSNLAAKMTPDLVHKNVVKNINPDYGQIGTKNNCRRATFAYEMRRRGFDVQATKTTNGSGQTVAGLQNATTPGKFKSTNMASFGARLLKEEIAKETDPKASTPLKDMTEAGAGGSRNTISGGMMGKTPIIRSTHIMDALGKEPSGSRGELVITFLGGGGHSVAYEIFDGKPVVFDTQSGEKYDSADAFTKGLGTVTNAGFTRLDNVPLNTEYLGRWVKNAK